MMRRGFLNTKAATDTRRPLGRRPPPPSSPASGDSSSPVLSIDKFSLERFLGRGNFCEVFEALPFQKSLFDGKPVAIKIFDRQRVSKLQKARDVVMERHCMLRLNSPGHPNIIRLLGTFKDQHSVYIVYELAENGELWDLVRYGGVGNDDLATRYIFSLASAIDYMHGKGIVHRDIKAENIVLMRDGNIKVIDFGTAVDQQHPEVQPAVLGAVPPPSTSAAPPGAKNTQRGGGGCPAPCRPSFVHHVGTPQFMSPEAVQNKDSGQLRDLWSFGCTIYQILTGFPPFDASTNYFVFLRVQARDLHFPPGFPSDARDLVEQLLAADPHARLGAAGGMKEVWGHRFFTGRLQRIQRQLLHCQKDVTLRLHQKQQHCSNHHQHQHEHQQHQQQKKNENQQHSSSLQQQQFITSETHRQQRQDGHSTRPGGGLPLHEDHQQQQLQEQQQEQQQGQEKQQKEKSAVCEEQLTTLVQHIAENISETPAPVASLQELCLQSIMRRVGELLDEQETKEHEKETEAFHQAAAAVSFEGESKASDDDEEHEADEGVRGKEVKEKMSGYDRGRRGKPDRGEEKSREIYDAKKEKKVLGRIRRKMDTQTQETTTAAEEEFPKEIEERGGKDSTAVSLPHAPCRPPRAGSAPTPPASTLSKDDLGGESHAEAKEIGGITARGTSAKMKEDEDAHISSVGNGAVGHQEEATGPATLRQPTTTEEDCREQAEGTQQETMPQPQQESKEKKRKQQQPQQFVFVPKSQKQQQHQRDIEVAEDDDDEEEEEEEQRKTRQNRREHKGRDDAVREKVFEEQIEEEEGEEENNMSSAKGNKREAELKEEDQDTPGDWTELVEAVVGKEQWKKHEQGCSRSSMQLLLERVKYMASSRKKVLHWQHKIAAQWLAESNERRINEEEEEEENEDEERKEESKAHRKA